MQQMLSMWALSSLEIPRCIVHFFFFLHETTETFEVLLDMWHTLHGKQFISIVLQHMTV